MVVEVVGLRILLVFACCLHSFGSTCLGNPLLRVYFPSLQSTKTISAEDILVEHARMVSNSHARYWPYQKPRFRSPLAPSAAPASSPAHQAATSGPSSARSPRRHGHHHHHHYVPVTLAPSPSEEGSCEENCADPLTATPFGSPCGCVLPMKVKLILDVAPITIFPVMNELEIEVASGTYLQQSQVKIMGATADTQNQGRTVVDINLVPLGEKFDNTTALLTCDRFMHKKVPLNITLFGNYEVISIVYAGFSSSPSFSNYTGGGPSGTAGTLPISANFENKNQKMNLRTVAIIALSAFVLVLVFIMAMFILIRWRKFGRPSSAVGPAFVSSLNKRSGIGSYLSSSIPSSMSGSFMSTMATCMLSVRTFSFNELEKATDMLSSRRILGEGGFGCVYSGIMEDNTEVAVKMLTRDIQNGDREFIAEVEMLSRLHHRNLVKLIGICIEGRTRCLVYELVHNGSVESHLHGFDKRKGPLDWDARLKIALGAARGLAYLHEDSNPRVIHRDFKASNVLLEEDFTPKVSDFGLAREATEGSQHISTRVMGTFGYVAPEYAMTGHLLVKSDVYSYGVVLLELLSGRKPVDMSQAPGQENLVTWARPLLTTREGLEQLVDPSLAGSYDFDDMAKVAAIASMCVHPEVTNRPFMGEVVQALKLIYNDSNETCGDNYSQKESSILDSDFKVDLAPSDSSWWNAAVSPQLHYGHTMTMDYSSGPLEGMENRGFSASIIGREQLSMANRSGPLRTAARSKRAFYRLRGSISEHGGLFTRHERTSGYWV